MAQAVIVDLLVAVGFFIGLPALLVGAIYLIVRSFHRSSEPDAEPCESCGYDLRGGHLKCPECGQPTRQAQRARLKKLLEEWPSNGIEPRRPAPHETPVVVFQTVDGRLASLLCDHLLVRGVFCEMNKPGSSIDPITMQHMIADHRLLVWSEDFEPAKEIIRRLLPEDAVAEPTEAQVVQSRVGTAHQ
jgi:hypothetical protein